MLTAMAMLSHSESRRLYSWWWDSHFSPKNSKWLQDNLTDMDFKVKAMIKLIEEDADSFARRAEMYYKKRPELMKFVEEFYRAYRALAERYDHATGALRQAHRTMAEAFPNQMALALSDDSPSGTSVTEVEPHTPEMPTPIRALFEPDDLHKDALGLSSQSHSVKRNGTFSDESDASVNKRGLKQLNEMFSSGEGAPHVKSAEGRVRKGLNFHDEEGKDSGLHNSLRDFQKDETGGKEDAFGKTRGHREEASQMFAESNNLKLQVKSEAERASKAETEVQRLQESLSRSEGEKEAALFQYQKSLERISDLESEISLRLEDIRKLNAETQIGATNLNSAKENSLLLEKENQSLQLELRMLEQKTIHQQQELQKKQNELGKLKNSLQDELTCSAQAEISFQYLKKLSAQSQEELRISALEVKSKVDLLKDMELRKKVLEDDLCQVKKENDHLNKELSQKLEELEKLNVSVQDERMRSLQAEASLKTLENLYSQSQEEVRVLVFDVERKTEILKDMELVNQKLEAEVGRIKEENGHLNKQNLSSDVMVKELQGQILSSLEAQEELKNKVELHADGKKVVQQELSHLKEKLDALEQRYQSVMEQIESIGLNAESLQASVKELQNGNIELKETCKKHEDENVFLLDKLRNAEKISEKNAVLENSLSDANVELEGLREKLKPLEESCESLDRKNSALLSENGVLVLQIEAITQNMEKLSENNAFLENSLSDANAESEGLRVKLKSLEEFIQSLLDEKSKLLEEKNTLVSQEESTRSSLENLEKGFAKLEDKLSCLQKEKESAVHSVTELQNLLELQEHEYETLILSTMNQMTNLEDQIILLEEKERCREKEIIEEQHKLLGAHIEIFILQRCICDLQGQNLSLLKERQKHLDALRSAERQLTGMNQENLLQCRKIEVVTDHNEKYREGTNLVLKALDIGKDYEFSDGTDDGLCWQNILDKFNNMQVSISLAQDECQKLLLERSVIFTLIWQLRLDLAEQKSAKSTIEQEYKIRNKECSVLQNEKLELLEKNGQVRQEVQAGYEREEFLKTEIQILGGQLLELEKHFQMSQAENLKLHEEKQCLSEELLHSRGKMNMLEEENGTILLEAMTLHCLSSIFEQYNAERTIDQKIFTDELYCLHGINNELEKKVRDIVERSRMIESENLHLKDTASKIEECRCRVVILEVDLNMARDVSEELDYQMEQLNQQVEAEKNMLIQKEIELSEVNQKFEATQFQHCELHKNFEKMIVEFNKAETVREDLEKRIVLLSEAEALKDKEIACSYESNKRLGLQLDYLQKQIEEHRIREKRLTCELANEGKFCEEEVATLYSDLHTTSIHAVLFEEKFFELIGACEGVDIFAVVQRQMLDKEITSRDSYIDEVNNKINELEGENVEVKSNLNGYQPLVLSLSKSISHLGEYILYFIKSHASNPQKIEDDSLLTLEHDIRDKVSTDDISRTVADGNLELQKLQSKVEVLQEVLAEYGRLSVQKKFVANRRMEASREEIDGSELNISSILEEVRTNKAASMQLLKKGEEPGMDVELKNNDIEGSNEKPGVMMKDIQLDHVSSSSFSIGTGLNENNGSEKAETDDQMLELWETAERDCNHKTEKAPLIDTVDDLEYHQIQPVEEEKSEYPSSELVAEKELGIDKLEVPKKVESLEEWSKRVLKTLASDAERLSALQTSLQELKEKMDKSEKSDYSESSQYDVVKVQIKDAEEAILKLFSINSRLTKKTEDCCEFSEKDIGEHEETINHQKGQVLEHTRRGSEKIGRLELELHRIQYILLKLQEELENNRIKAAGRRPRVLLRDYLYGRRDGLKRKKGHLCGCIRPKTKGD